MQLLIRQLCLVFNDWFVRPFFKLAGFHIRPRLLNLSLTDRCNEDCVMCKIGDEYRNDLWKGRRQFELTPEELRMLLCNPLFNRIQDIGVSGGEPFMVNGITSYVKIIIDSLPKLKTFTISSNMILLGKIQKSVPEIAKICASKKIRFIISFSMDGIGKVNDLHRNLKGAWQKTYESLLWLQKNTDIKLVAGVTVTGHNVRHLFPVYSYIKKSGFKGNFRTAVLIDRLKNKTRIDELPLPGYETWEFFSKLAHDKHITSLERRIFYRHLLKMLDGGERTYRCRFSQEGLFVGAMGDIAHCAVYGQPFHSAESKKNPFKEWQCSHSLLKDMATNACGTCRHDYRGYLSLNDILSVFWERIKGPQVFSLVQGFVACSSPLPTKRLSGQLDFSSIRTVVITGWYGTETVGDIAILGGIYERLIKENEKMRFRVLSTDPFFTKHSVEQLGYDSITDIFHFSESRKAFNGADILLIGGGPMMDLAEIGTIQFQLQKAQQMGLFVGLYGCGIGPAHKIFTRMIVSRMVNAADLVWLRDDKSVLWCKKRKTEPHRLSMIGDPAEWYVKSKKVPSRPVKPYLIGINLRMPDLKYAQNVSAEEYRRAWENMNNAVDKMLSWWLDRDKKNQVLLVPMNTFWRGGDDREALYSLAEKYGNDHVKLKTESASISSTIESIQQCSVFVGMRYHSCVFAAALEVPVVGIEYNASGKGKIYNFFKNRPSSKVIPIYKIKDDVLISSIKNVGNLE